MDTNMSGTTSNAPSDGPAAFLSQPFSAATEMILKRLRGEGGLVNHDLTSGLQASNNIPGYEDVRRSVMNSMRTSSAFVVSTPAPSPSVLGKKSRLQGRGSGSATPSTSVKKTGGGGGGRGKKRKRKMEDTEEEEESDSLSDMGESDSSLSEDEEASTPAAFPAVTQSGRKVVRPSQFVPESASKAKGKQGKGKKGAKKVKDEMCMRCGRGHSPKTNMIVFCDGCDRGWHQMCHDPMIRDEIVRNEGTEWFCSECTEKRNKKQKEKAEAEARRRSQNSTPVAMKPEPKKWDEMTVSEQRQHLSSMPHYHLVDLLIGAKTLFPSIPITPLSTSSSRYLNGRIDDRRTNIHRQQPFPPSAAQGLFSRADANPSGQLNYIRKVPPGSTLPMSNAAMSRQNSGTPRPRSAGPVAPAGFGTYNTFQQLSYTPSNNADIDAIGEPDTTFTTNDQTQAQTQQKQQGQTDGAEEEEEDDSPPPSPPYPKPGNGLMSRLKSDEEDLEWLVGNEREGEAFSHLLFEQGQGDGQGMGGGMQGEM